MSSSKFVRAMRSLAPLLRGILFYGDPHSNWEPLLAGVQEHNPHTVVILGDLIDGKNDLHAITAARSALTQLLAQGIDVRIISGNHDVDSDAIYDLVFGEFGHLIFDGSVVELGPNRVRVAGLGGVFRGRVWNPSISNAPAFFSPEDWLQAHPRTSWFRGGLARKQHGTVFPSYVEQLRQTSADVLVTHEAPSTHEFGFDVIDDLAKALGVKLLVYGHHHRVIETVLPETDIAVRGTGMAEVWKPWSWEIRRLICRQISQALHIQGCQHEP
jgi:predicted phosphodiesterase